MSTNRDDWQPMETAPKDGTRILIGWFEGKRFRQRAAWWYPSFDQLDDGSWVGAWVDGDIVSSGTTSDYRRYEPTHWMPLPAAPTK